MNSSNFNLLLCTLKTLKLYTLRYYILANRLHKLRLHINFDKLFRKSLLLLFSWEVSAKTQTQNYCYTLLWIVILVKKVCIPI